MIRVTAWTCGLFALGWGICRLFPGPLVEPIVLLALGTTLFLVAGRAAVQREDEPGRRSDDVTSSTTRAEHCPAAGQQARSSPRPGRAIP
jgi:hypothetical protein